MVLRPYEDLRHTDFQVPRILVIVSVPQTVSEWVEQDPEKLLLRHGAWWVSLRGSPASSNIKTVRVKVPCAQMFDISGLSGLMQRIADGGLP